MSGPLQKNIPQLGDLISNSQVDLLQNSQFWVDSLSKDHKIANGDTSGTSFEGRHIQVALNDRADDNLAFVGDGANSQLWGSNGALWWRNSTSAAFKVIDNSAQYFFPIRATATFSNAAVPVVTSSNNITSVTRTGTGRFTITMATTLPTADYIVLTTGCESTIGGSTGWATVVKSTQTTTTFQIETFQSNGNASNTNPNFVNFIVFGG